MDGSHFDNQADAATHESEGLGHYGIAATAILALFFLGEPGRQALRNLRLDIVIITVCSPTRKRRTKTSALSFMAVSIMCFLRPYSVLMEHRDEPPVCWSAVVSSASQNRLARLGMVAPFPWDIDCAGPPPVLRSNAQSWPETKSSTAEALAEITLFAQGQHLRT